MIQSKQFGEWVTAWIRMNDYKKARWKLTGMYILVFFVLLNLFTFSLLVILQKVENDYVQKTEMVWKKQVVFSGQNVTVLKWEGDNGVNKQDIMDLHRSFLEDIRYWIVIIEVGLLLIAGFVSYFLAGKTLAPIQKKNELQKQFLADVSHELNNPLSALKTSLEIAKKQKDWTQGEIEDIFRDMEEEVSRLIQTTHNLLILEREDSEVQGEKIDLSKVINTQIEILQNMASKRNIKLIKDLNTYIKYAVLQDAERVIFNLLHNAIKFSLPNSEINITLSQKGELKIKDKGIGIAKKDLGYIFDRFYKSDNSRTFGNNNGSGLGLAIVKKIADKNNWKILVNSKEGESTEFVVKF